MLLGLKAFAAWLIDLLAGLHQLVPFHRPPGEPASCPRNPRPGNCDVASREGDGRLGRSRDRVPEGVRPEARRGFSQGAACRVRPNAAHTSRAASGGQDSVPDRVLFCHD